MHTFVKARQNGNAIEVLTKADRTLSKTRSLIKEKVRECYLNLMGSASSSLPMIDKAVISRGLILDITSQQQLCKEVSDSEIKASLFCMNDQKAPGIDGFNVVFYKQAWKVIGTELMGAVKHLFAASLLPKSINMALLALIPKVPTASSIKEYRPIAYCIILYKILQSSSK